MSKRSAQTKVATFCRLIQSATMRRCECGQEATFLVSMNVVKDPERRFVCKDCLDKLPKATPFEEGARAWIRPLNGPHDIRMVNHAHSVGHGAGVAGSFRSHGNGTAALKFED